MANVSDEKEKAFEGGKAVIAKELNEYFDEHPEAYKSFLKWSEKEENPDKQ